MTQVVKVNLNEVYSEPTLVEHCINSNLEYYNEMVEEFKKTIGEIFDLDVLNERRNILYSNIDTVNKSIITYAKGIYDKVELDSTLVRLITNREILKANIDNLENKEKTE